MAKQQWVVAMQERIKTLEQELAAERRKPMLQMFAQRLGNDMLVKLASTPYDKWPQFAKDTFAWTANDMPTLAYEYKELLPK